MAFQDFQKSLHPCALEESSLSIGMSKITIPASAAVAVGLCQFALYGNFSGHNAPSTKFAERRAAGAESFAAVLLCQRKVVVG